MQETLALLEDTTFPPLKRGKLHTLQVNLGYLCNQQCLHCHVNAGPKRTEIMNDETIDDIIQYLSVSDIKTLDLTGGAPEMNPHFRHLVKQAKNLGVHVIDRCNLTILSEPKQDDLAEFLQQHEVEIIASLPCYLEDNVNKQRGKGVFNSSIHGLKKLNALGYGVNPELTLNLVYNPQGAVLPPPQEQLKKDYTNHLRNEFDIVFNDLFTITNMPIKRFGSMLVSKGEFEPYMDLLKNAYKPSNLNSVMCLNLVSVDWQGFIYDCDFNQMLALPSQVTGKAKLHIKDLKETTLEREVIVVKDHCFGCTAGQGSSCGGALD